LAGTNGDRKGYRLDMDRRRMVSFLLPLVGLAITVPELLRLIDARRAAEACLERAQTEQITCEASPDLMFLVVAGIFGLVFVARLAFLAYEYMRSSH
jgi:hypothetical protein